MKRLKKGLSILLLFSVFCTVVKLSPISTVQAATKSTAKEEIAKLEKDIKKWQKELDEYNKKADKATKGTMSVLLGSIENMNPLIIRTGLWNITIPYIHVVNYSPTFEEALIGGVTGYFRSLGTYTYQYKNEIVPDYEKVDDYSSERSQLERKIEEAQKKIDQLKIDMNAKFTLIGDKKFILYNGASYTILYELTEGVSDTTVSWSTSDKKIATVSKDGTITAKAVGSTKITGKAKLNGKTITVTVTVKEAAESVSLKTKSLKLEMGETKQLKATFSPAKSYAEVEWISSDISVADVDKNGIVTAVAPGTAYIYACTNIQRLSNACKVTVTGKDVSYEKASNATAAVALVKASGYLETGVDYFFEVMRGDDKRYVVNVYPFIDEYAKELCQGGDWPENSLFHESYALKSGGKKVYFQKEKDNWTGSYGEMVSYSMFQNLQFKDSSISVQEGNYKELALKASHAVTMDYLRMTSENPEIAEIAVSASTGKLYVKGKKSGTTTVTAEAKNGQKATLLVKVTEAGLEEEAGDECLDPLTAATHPGNGLPSSGAYSNRKSIPLSQYYVFCEKDRSALVLTGSTWYDLKNWAVGARFILGQ